MVQKSLIVEGRQFRTEVDYNRAIRDKQTLDEIRGRTNFNDRKQLEQLSKELSEGVYRFYSLLEQDFREEVEEALQKAADPKTTESRAVKSKKVFKAAGQKSTGKKAAGKKTTGQTISGRESVTVGNTKGKRLGQEKAVIDEQVKQELLKQERRRKLLVLLCSVIAVGCLGYFTVYSYYEYRTRQSNEALTYLKDQSAAGSSPNLNTPRYTLTEQEAPEVLEEYKNLLNKNKKLIGWLRIDDTNTDKPFLDYPVMQTINNEYYLDHNLNQEYDKNGSIFMDKDCDVLKPSTNFIVYGHNMKSGQMFGKLDKYSSEEFYKEHQYIQFDTIYEKGTYEVMYVFRSHIYSEEDIVFKYYQFIDALSAQEFDSYMQEMSALSLYDTGVTAQFGNQLLTLSTCDYFADGGRFVVVAKKLAE